MTEMLYLFTDVIRVILSIWVYNYVKSWCWAYNDHVPEPFIQTSPYVCLFCSQIFPASVILHLTFVYNHINKYTFTQILLTIHWNTIIVDFTIVALRKYVFMKYYQWHKPIWERKGTFITIICFSSRTRFVQCYYAIVSFCV